MSDGAPAPAIPEEIEALLAQISGVTALPARLERITEALLGRPYLSFPLIGGPDVPEQMVTRTDAFDCVTFAETALALGWSATAADFEPNLAAIRYHHGRLRWRDRNHYMTEWIRRNRRTGRVEWVLPHQWVRAEPTRTLSVLPRYHQVRWRPSWFPSTAIDALAAHARAGDLVAFVSDRQDLDTFHVGLLIPGDPLAVRHAGRSAGKVVHQDLAGFLAQNGVPGMLIVRPTPRGVSR